ncbi:MAG: DUF4162 domain-containing protein, partial [Anaerolineales bacterium]
MEVDPLNGVSADDFKVLPGVRKVTHTPQDGFSQLDLILEADDALSNIVVTLTSKDIRILNLQKREPTLEDVFVDLVGRSMEEVEHVG